MRPRRYARPRPRRFAEGYGDQTERDHAEWRRRSNVVELKRPTNGDATSRRAGAGLRMARHLPPAQWLRAYRREWLPRDAVAGVTLAAYAIPVSLAYATLAGLPPQHGIYCYLLGGALYALFGTSRQLAVGPTSAISLLVGTSIAVMAAGNAARFAEHRRADRARVRRHQPARLGVASQLTGGIHQRNQPVRLQGGRGHHDRHDAAAEAVWCPGRRRSFRAARGSPRRSADFPETNLAVLGFGLAAIAMLLLGEKFLPGRPIALVVVVGSVVALSVTPLAELGFKTVGALPSGLPALHLPSTSLADVQSVIPLAFACFLLAYIESVSAARAFALKHRYGVDPRQEFLGLGAAILAAPLAGLPRRRRVVAARSTRRAAPGPAVAGLRLGHGRPGAPLLHRPLSQPAGGRPGRDRARRRGGSDRPQGAAVAVAREPVSSPRPGGAGRRAAPGAWRASCSPSWPRCRCSCGPVRGRTWPSSGASPGRAGTRT